ncbi:hypothetical protein BTVI_23817 [Pitangus sulphuratus]|nr:hypothetical protein BTVI_23817 [Pitangus sulphuratus]
MVPTWLMEHLKIECWKTRRQQLDPQPWAGCTGRERRHLGKEGAMCPRSGSHFFHRNSLSPRSLVYESEFSTIEPALDMYDENKT